MSIVSKCSLGFVVAVLVLGIGQAHAVTVPADIVFVIDISGSMQDDIDQVTARIGDFNTAMVDNAIDARYGLVRFGDDGFDEVLLQDVTDFSTFETALIALRDAGAYGTGVERGSAATQLALDTATFRSDAVKNFILITDEDDDSPGSVPGLDADLQAANALFNFIGVPGVGNTNSTYGVLAANNGGTAFNINDFRSNPDPFFENFINTKVKEIKDTVIPEPMTMAAMFMGVATLGGYLRKRRAA